MSKIAIDATIQLKSSRTPTHPWIWSAQVRAPEQALPPGSIVNIVDANARFVGRGFWNGHARIALRLLSTKPSETIDAAWIGSRIHRAIALRRELLKLDRDSNAWRVVNSEGDDLSGLIVDRYADVLVIEYFAAGMWKFRETIHTTLTQAFPRDRKSVV